MQNFRVLGAPAPLPPAAGDFTPSLRRLEAPPPDPQNSPSYCEFLATRLEVIVIN